MLTWLHSNMIYDSNMDYIFKRAYINELENYLFHPHGPYNYSCFPPYHLDLENLTYGIVNTKCLYYDGQKLHGLNVTYEVTFNLTQTKNGFLPTLSDAELISLEEVWVESAKSCLEEGRF